MVWGVRGGREGVDEQDREGEAGRERVGVL